MKATLKFETENSCKEIEVEVADAVGKQLIEDLSQKKKTGYEKVREDETYYYVCNGEYCDTYINHNDETDNKMYKNANYYSSKEVAENNCRADKLMRQLRRFSVEHRERQIVLGKPDCSIKYKIVFDCYEEELNVSPEKWNIDFGGIYFESVKVAKLAIETFHDELIWYFTEYKDSI